MMNFDTISEEICGHIIRFTCLFDTKFDIITVYHKIHTEHKNIVKNVFCDFPSV